MNTDVVRQASSHSPTHSKQPPIKIFTTAAFASFGFLSTLVITSLTIVEVSALPRTAPGLTISRLRAAGYACENLGVGGFVCTKCTVANGRNVRSEYHCDRRTGECSHTDGPRELARPINPNLVRPPSPNGNYPTIRAK